MVEENILVVTKVVFEIVDRNRSGRLESRSLVFAVLFIRGFDDRRVCSERPQRNNIMCSMTVKDRQK